MYSATRTINDKSSKEHKNVKC